MKYAKLTLRDSSYPLIRLVVSEYEDIDEYTPCPFVYIGSFDENEIDKMLITTKPIKFYVDSNAVKLFSKEFWVKWLPILEVEYY